MKRQYQPAARGLCASGRPGLMRFICLVLLIGGTASKAPAQRGIIRTYAGGGPSSKTALSAEIIGPQSVAVDTSENIYITAFWMHQVFRVDRGGNFTVVAGNGIEGFSGDGESATSASLDWPFGVAVDVYGMLFIADFYNNRVREVPLPPFVALSTSELAFATQKVGTTSKPQVITLANTGTATLEIESLAIGGTDARDLALTRFGIFGGGAIAGNDCGSSVEPGARCQIHVTFTPQKAGNHSATLSTTDNAPHSPQTVTLSGTGSS